MESGQLATALAAAQAELKDPTRNKSGQVKGRTDYRYAGLDDLLQAVRPALTKHGIALAQIVDVRDGQVGLRSELLHTSGESIGGFYPLDWSGNPQARGSELTYARRYSLEALVGVAATEDDDASSASDDRDERDEAADQQPEPEKAPEPNPSQAAIDLLVKENWPAETVVAEVRDFFRWCGIAGDPWSMTEERQVKIPAWITEQQPRLDAWMAWWDELDALLKKKRPPLGRGDVAAWCAANERPVPETMDEETRGKLLAYLRDTDGLKVVAEFVRDAKKNTATKEAA